MNETIVHRGPDDEGIYCGEGHRLRLPEALSIIDLSAAISHLQRGRRLWSC